MPVAANYEIVKASLDRNSPTIPTDDASVTQRLIVQNRLLDRVVEGTISLADPTIEAQD